MVQYAVLNNYYGYGNPRHERFGARNPDGALKIIMLCRKNPHDTIFRDRYSIYITNGYTITNQIPIQNINIKTIINDYIFDIERVKGYMVDACGHIEDESTRQKYMKYILNLDDKYRPDIYIDKLQSFKDNIKHNIKENISKIKQTIPDINQYSDSIDTKMKGEVSQNISTECEKIINIVKENTSASINVFDLQAYKLYNYICILIDGYNKYKQSKDPMYIGEIVNANIHFTQNYPSGNYIGYYSGVPRNTIYMNNQQFIDTNETKRYSNKTANTLLSFLILEL